MKLKPSLPPGIVLVLYFSWAGAQVWKEENRESPEWLRCGAASVSLDSTASGAAAGQSAFEME